MNRKRLLKCRKCGLHKTRRQVVLGRGDLPCDVLFIGEAPGQAEDLRGVPFIGPSGRLLTEAMKTAVSLAGVPAPTFYITNCCACRPCDNKQGPNRQPTGEEMWACFQRLEAEAKEANPKRVVLLGKIAEANCKKMFPGALCLYHPAYILRCGGTNSAVYKKFTRDLSALFKEVYDEKVQD